MTTGTWRTSSPDWCDNEKHVELKMKDGTVWEGMLDLVDHGFDGEEEYPIWEVKVHKGGGSMSLWDAECWRFI